MIINIIIIIVITIIIIIIINTITMVLGWLAGGQALAGEEVTDHFQSTNFLLVLARLPPLSQTGATSHF